MAAGDPLTPLRNQNGEQGSTNASVALHPETPNAESHDQADIASRKDSGSGEEATPAQGQTDSDRKREAAELLAQLDAAESTQSGIELVSPRAQHDSGLSDRLRGELQEKNAAAAGRFPAVDQAFVEKVKEALAS